MNPLIFIFKLLAKNIIIFIHNIIILIPIFFIFDLNLGLNILYGLLGFFILSIILFFTSAILGLVGARFRDITPIIQTLLQITFFISPITWLPRLVGDNSYILYFNPIANVLDITRSPILGEIPAYNSWIFSMLYLKIDNK